MINYQLFHFAAPPRTGVSWVIKAAQLIGLGPAFAHQAHMPFPPKERNGPDSYRVSLVRHPCTWLASCYSAIRYGDLTTNHVAAYTRLDLGTFDQFVRSYLVTMPGGVGQLYDTYEAECSMRIEDMPDAFLELADSFGVPKEMSAKCRLLGKQNMTASPPVWDKGLWKRVMEAERDTVESYDYF